MGPPSGWAGFASEGRPVSTGGETRLAWSSISGNRSRSRSSAWSEASYVPDGRDPAFHDAGGAHGRPARRADARHSERGPRSSPTSRSRTSQPSRPRASWRDRGSATCCCGGSPRSARRLRRSASMGSSLSRRVAPARSGCAWRWARNAAMCSRSSRRTGCGSAPSARPSA